MLFFQVQALSKEWADRAALPGHVVTMLNNFPSNLHPMSQFAAAIAALNSESKFAKAYADGIHKSKYWEVSAKLFKFFYLDSGYLRKLVFDFQSTQCSWICTSEFWFTQSLKLAS